VLLPDQNQNPWVQRVGSGGWLADLEHDMLTAATIKAIFKAIGYARRLPFATRAASHSRL
jgi:hypothetical protein